MLSPPPSPVCCAFLRRRCCSVQTSATGTKLSPPPSFVPSSRSLVENAVQSCLQIPDLATKDAVEARLLRAKTRFFSGYTLGAHRGLFTLFLSLFRRQVTHRVFSCVW